AYTISVLRTAELVNLNQLFSVCPLYIAVYHVFPAGGKPSKKSIRNRNYFSFPQKRKENIQKCSCNQKKNVNVPRPHFIYNNSNKSTRMDKKENRRNES
ncbi:MAG: hypothetical protein J6M20_00085, partial [Clostridia bacterium]|nr:hypothetical protein [Clostridia bacterium]